MSVSSFNVQGFFDWDERQANIITYFKQVAVDVIFMQEVTYIPEESAYTQAHLLKNDLPLYRYENSAIARLQDSPHYSEYREGLAVLSRYPITYSETVVLKKDPADEHQRLVQFVDILHDDGQIIKFANIHFSITDTTEAYARAQLIELFQILEARNETRIICGDFNMKNIDLHADVWGEQYAVSNDHQYITYPDEQKQMDYIMIPKSMTFNRIEVSPSGLSDHCALTASIVLPGEASRLRRRFVHAQKLFVRHQ